MPDRQAEQQETDSNSLSSSDRTILFQADLLAADHQLFVSLRQILHIDEEETNNDLIVSAVRELDEKAEYRLRQIIALRGNNKRSADRILELMRTIDALRAEKEEAQAAVTNLEKRLEQRAETYRDLDAYYLGIANNSDKVLGDNYQLKKTVTDQAAKIGELQDEIVTLRYTAKQMEKAYEEKPFEDADAELIKRLRANIDILSSLIISAMRGEDVDIAYQVITNLR